MTRLCSTALTVLSISAAAIVLSSSPAHACKMNSCAPQQTDNGWVNEYDATNEVMHPIPANDGARDGTPPTWEYRYWHCDDADANCLNTCDAGGEPGIFLYMDRRPYGSDDAWEIDYGDGLCLVPSDGIPREEIETRIYEYVAGYVDLPTAQLAPPNGIGVVNLPVIVWSEEQPPLTLDVTNPVPGQLYAEPTYRWTFSDGASYNGPGRAYDGTDPDHAPDGYYIANRYDQTGPASVTLTHNWDATFTYEGINGPATLTLDPLVLDDHAEFTIAEVGSVLAGDR